MPKITWLGDVDHPDNVGVDPSCTWGGYIFPLDAPVEVTDPHIIAKARTNRFFRVTEEPPPPEPATGRVDYNAAAAAAAANPAPVKRSHKKKVVPP
jgi:hypothetical protein